MGNTDMRVKEWFMRQQMKPEPVKKDHTPIQFSDQMRCRKCGKVWDTNDPEPPECD